MQTDNNLAQLEVRTGYDSQGYYEIPVSVSDQFGNITTDMIRVIVEDVNRTPVFNQEYGVITLNIADPLAVYTIDPMDMFTDPDGDELQLLAGNLTPEVIDLALGVYYADIHPLTTGTGYLLFGADDGKENGFVIAEVYVLIINDPNAAGASTDGFGEIPGLDEKEQMRIYPNPVSNGIANIVLKVEEDSYIQLGVFDMNGRKFFDEINGLRNKGVYNVEMDVSSLDPGLYFCRYMVNGQLRNVSRLVVR